MADIRMDPLEVRGAEEAEVAPGRGGPVVDELIMNTQLHYDLALRNSLIGITVLAVVIIVLVFTLPTLFAIGCDIADRIGDKLYEMKCKRRNNHVP